MGQVFIKSYQPDCKFTSIAIESQWHYSYFYHPACKFEKLPAQSKMLPASRACRRVLCTSLTIHLQNRIYRRALSWRLLGCPSVIKACSLTSVGNIFAVGLEGNQQLLPRVSRLRNLQTTDVHVCLRQKCHLIHCTNKTQQLINLKLCSRAWYFCGVWNCIVFGPDISLLMNINERTCIWTKDWGRF